MIKKLLVCIYLFPLFVFAQKTNSLKLTSRTDSAWIALVKGWKFKAGDNRSWASPDFNDSAWQNVKAGKANNVSQNLSDGGIFWFRSTISIDSGTRPLVLRVYQTGASEVYLDGRLVHKLGTVGLEPDKARYYSPNSELLSFPLKYNATQLLAIRFRNLPDRLPLYSLAPRSRLQLFVTNLDYGVNDYTVRFNRTFINRIYVAMGVLIVLFVLFLSFFLFFPLQKINLYFSLSNFFFVCYLVVQANIFYSHVSIFIFSVIEMALAALYVLLQLYCIYRIFGQKTGFVFKALAATGLLTVPAVFFFDDNLVSTAFAILVLLESIRISLISLHKNRTAARIILTGMVANAVYWVINLLALPGIINLPEMSLYVPLAFLIAPLSLAIYLGYSFGSTSYSLQQKISEIKKLSLEKEELLLAQNETLEKQVAERTTALKSSLENLKNTQTQLIQSEKMASLGELTAGIAHEIQNPLNFVNNFSEVNKEMLEELRAENKKPKAERDGQLEIELINDLIENEEKITHHGKRADSIIKGMLQHSRAGGTVKEPANINILADEYLRLAYHGLRAKDKTFNAGLDTDFDDTLPLINIVPQDIGRVLLNLFNNAFYALQQRQKADLAFKPAISVSTTLLRLPFGKSYAVITIKDNGIGIPDDIKDKILQPFFTTKPAGEGTGLGLSLSYDIVVKAHDGEIDLVSKPGEYTEFKISIPV